MSDNLDKRHLAETRRLVESSVFKQELRSLLNEYPILRELYIGIKHELSGYAHINRNKCQGFYWKDTLPLDGIPVFSVMYTIDAGTVHLSSIIVVPEDQQ